MDHKSEKPSERIAKVMARAGLCSRREAEDWIAAGRVAVNGTIIASPALDVADTDRIEVDGRPLPVKERTRLFLYHKPRGLVTTNADPQGRPTIFDALPKGLPRLISVGRLDINSEGLLLLTNDGGLARALELPETGWLRRYRVRALGHITQDRLDTLRRGLSVAGIRYGPIEATLDRQQGANVWITFAMREGKNREVRNVLGALDLHVNRLIRVSYGPFHLEELAEGAIEEVRTRHLREQIGQNLANLAGVDFSGPIAEHESPTEEAPTARPEPREAPVAAPRPASVAPSARGERHERTPRDDRSKGRGEDRGRDRDRSRDRDHSGRDRDDKKPRRMQRHHSDTHAWRGGDAPLRRKYRGAAASTGGDRDVPASPKKAGLVADRKGRRVLVERFGTKPPEPEARDKRHRRSSEPDAKRKYFRKGPEADSRDQRHRRPTATDVRDKRRSDAPTPDRAPRKRRGPPRDRSSGPRPARPRGPRAP